MITFVTAFYILKSKFSVDKYKKWMDKFLSNVKNFKLIIFTDKKSYHLIEKYKFNNNIHIELMEINEFYNYKYKKDWIKNHEKNYLLKDRITWELNMLWSEKISFIRKANELNIFDNEWYGWCDIGYFRDEEPGTISDKLLQQWPSHNKIKSLEKTKIYYSLVNNNKTYMNNLYRLIHNRDENNLPKVDIPPNQQSVAGGFFLIHKENIDLWYSLYDNTLSNYFKYERLVKDDQIILIDCIFSNMKLFKLISEKNINYNKWFVFQRYLL